MQDERRKHPRAMLRWPYDPDQINFSQGMAVRFLRMLENEHEVISTLITRTLHKDRIDCREEEPEK